ncbi:MAG: MBOAT family O-acyltransferase [Candidatus Microthrix parvicella]
MEVSLQIYGDFSGYTDIARGTSRLFGIELIRNFRQPYLSRNITEFWRTWHISLSNGLHDYLYVPLGGNRNGALSTYRNLMLTMLIGGLWHGASWTFVVWGGLHGLYLVAERAIGVSEHRGVRPPIRAGQLPSKLFTFALVSMTWVFFRADDFGQAMDVFRSLFSGSGGLPIEDVILVGVIALEVLLMDLYARRQPALMKVLQYPVVEGFAYGMLAVGVIVWSGGGGAQFIYFQF